MDPTLIDDPSIGDLSDSGDTIANVGLDPGSIDPITGDTIGNEPTAAAPGSYDPSLVPSGSVLPAAGSSAAGGSGVGTQLLSGLAGLATAGASIFKSLSGPTGYGVNAAGQSCQLGTVGCNPVQSSVTSGQTTMLVMVGLGALVLIIVLRGKK